MFVSCTKKAWTFRGFNNHIGPLNCVHQVVNMEWCPYIEHIVQSYRNTCLYVHHIEACHIPLRYRRMHKMNVRLNFVILLCNTHSHALRIQEDGSIKLNAIQLS